MRRALPGLLLVLACGDIDAAVERYKSQRDGGAAGGTTAGGSSAGGSTAGGSTAGGSTAGGSTAGGSTAGGSTAGGSTAGGNTAGGNTAGGSTAGGSTAGGSTAGGATAGGSTAGGAGTAGGSQLPDGGMYYLVAVDSAAGTTASAVRVHGFALADNALLFTAELPVASDGGVTRITLPGNSGNDDDGKLHLTADQTTLVLAGYDVAVGSASPRTSTAPRVIARVNLVTGAVSTTTVAAFSGSPVYAVAGTDPSNLWVAGSGPDAGLVYRGTGQATVLGLADVLDVVISRSQIFVTNSTTVYQAGTGTPMSAAAPAALFGVTNKSLAAIDDGTTPTLYVGLTPNEGNGVKKYSLDADGGGWGAAYHLMGGNGACRHVAARQLQSHVLVLCVDGSYVLNEWRDDGGSSLNSVTRPASLPAGQSPRGVAIP